MLRADRFPVSLQRPREPDVVAVEEDDVLAGRVTNAEVPRRAWALVRLGQNADAISESLEHRDRVVGRAVVDDHHLVVVEGLGEHRLQRPRDQVGAIEDGDDHREERQGGSGVVLRV